MRAYAKVLSPAVLVALANFLIFSITIDAQLGVILYNVLRVASIGYAGWLVAAKYGNRSGLIVLAGLIVFFADHVVFKGGYFLFEGLFDGGPTMGDWLAVNGVIVSFLMFSPLALVVSFLGGWLARKRMRPE